MVIAAPPGTFKSVLALNMANGLAGGSKLFDLFEIPRAVKVLYVDAEIGFHYFQQRLKLYYPTQESVPENLTLVTREDEEIAMKLDLKHRIKPLKSLIQTYQPNVIFLDCLNPLISEEESERAYSFAADYLSEIQRDNQDLAPSFVIIHHMRKLGPDHDPLDFSNIRGHSKLIDWPATRITMKCDRPDKLTLRFLLRHGPGVEDLNLVVDLKSLHITQQTEKGKGVRYAGSDYLNL